MLQKTYISKFNTIISGSTINTGLNPVAELVYGNNNNTRLLLYFDHSKLKEMVENKIYPDIAKFKHYLKITNAGSLNSKELHCVNNSSLSNGDKVRATSFDLIFFLIPQLWDGGKGFDYSTSLHHLINKNQSLISEDGSNWFESRNGYTWEEDGVYSNITLSKEYDKFSSVDGSSIIIGRQHFDVGNENINLDITDIVNKFITGELENYGIGIAFTPMTELRTTDVENYVGFLTHKTNTFFEPYVESQYHDYISDDRSNFFLDKKNKLYLYCNMGGETQNLDELPTCTINGTEYEVKQFSKGIYYVDVMLSKIDFKPNTMLYDTWSNIVYQGVKLDDVELDFVVKSSAPYFNIGNSIEESVKVTPKIYGIEYDEKIYRNGDVRRVSIINRVSYDKYKIQLLDKIEYRIYIKDGSREITVIPYTIANKTINENYFLLDCDILIPQCYYIDIKVHYNQECITHKDILKFQIIDNLDKKFN